MDTMMQDQSPTIDVSADRIHLHEFDIVDPNLVEYFQGIDVDEQRDAFEHALRVGVKTMQLAETSQQEEFVERKFTEMRTQFVGEIERVENEVETRFGDDGDVPKLFDTHLGDGGSLERHIERAFGEDGAFVTRLDEELGEDGERIQDALDPDTEGSPTYRLKTTVLDEIRALRDKLEEQATEEETREELTQRTTLKGDDFEATVETLLEDLVYGTSDEVEYTGETMGELNGRKVGDFVLTLSDTGQRIAIEAKSDASYTQPKIKDELEDALENRDADYAIMVFESEAQVPNKVGYFHEFDSDRLAVALSETPADEIDAGYLHIAFNWARTRAVQSFVDTEAAFDPEVLQIEINEVEEAIRRFSRLRKKTTNIRNSANGIDEELQAIQHDVTTRLGNVRAELQGR